MSTMGDGLQCILLHFISCILIISLKKIMIFNYFTANRMITTYCAINTALPSLVFHSRYILYTVCLSARV